MSLLNAYFGLANVTIQESELISVSSGDYFSKLNDYMLKKGSTVEGRRYGTTLKNKCRYLCLVLSP